VGVETGSASIRLALNQRDAAKALGVSVDAFAEHIAPTLRRVKCGRLWLYPVKELDLWLDRNAVQWAGS
jgi:predicted nucleotidyltransferase